MLAALKRAAKTIATRVLSPALIAAVIPFSSPRLKEADWDDEYASDVWKHLHTVNELARYSMIVGYCDFYRPCGSILEIGCGDGLLASRIRCAGVTVYLGVDMSSHAVATAQALNLEGFDFAAANAEIFQPPPDKSFDLLVFNEILYYFKSPEWEAQRYARSLKPDGLMVVSLLNAVRSHQVWTMLKKSFTTLDQTRVAHGDLAWDVRVLKPKR